MLLPAPPLVLRKPRANRFRVPKLTPTPVVTGPVLIAATYDVLFPSLTLTFDRAVNLTGPSGTLNAETITVHDGVNGIEQFNTPDAFFEGSETIVITLFPNAAWEGEGVTMTCGAGTGVVDGNGAPWAGVTDLELPFGRLATAIIS